MSEPFGVTVPARDSEVAVTVVADPVVAVGGAFVVKVASWP